MQIKDNVFLFPPESGLCFREGSGEGGRGVGNVGGSVGPSPWIVGGARGCRSSYRPQRSKGLGENWKPPQAETTWLFL